MIPKAFLLGDPDYIKQWLLPMMGASEASFDPILDRSSKTKVAVLESDQHQVFGCFSWESDSGMIRLLLNLKIFWFAEKVHNKW